MNTAKAKVVMKVMGGISLLLFPIMLMIAFALHFESLSEFFDFRLRYEPNTAAAFMETLRNPGQAQRYFVVPHLVGYLSMPLLIFTAFSLGYILFERRPWFALVGTTLTSIGAIFMSGVFASWLSFAAIGNIPADQVPGAIPVLAALTEMQGAMMYSTLLSALSLVGLMVLALGLYLSGVVPKWSGGMLLGGNLLILLFTDLDNWMFIGALLMLIGMTPISLKLLRGSQAVKLFGYTYKNPPISPA